MPFLRSLAAGPALAAALSVAALAVGAGCGGASSGLEGSVYRGDRTTFRIGEVPPEWQRVSVDEASLAYRDETHRASVLVNARCGRKDDDTPLAALTAHLVMGTTERETTLEEKIPFDGREALHTRMKAKLDGVPRAFDLYVLKKDGCVYDFAYVGDPAAIEAGVPAFEHFVQGFHTGGAT